MSATKERNVLIFDLGGGTFDITLLGIESGVIEVKATNGNTHLGGSDFDNALVEFAKKEFKKTTDIDIGPNTRNGRCMARLRTALINAKHELSNAAST